MAPHMSKYHHTRIMRAWWKCKLTPIGKLIQYYNNYVLPNVQDYSIRMLTKAAFNRVMQHMDTIHIFETDNHFITHPRMLITDARLTSFAVLCAHCITTQKHKYNQQTHQFIDIKAKEHFTFPKTMVHNLIEMTSIWCSSCGGNMFNWHAKDQCPQCT